MTATTKYLVLTAFVLTLSQLAPCQSAAVHLSVPLPTETKGCKPPKNRELFHDYINKAQETLLRSDGKNDAQFTPSGNDEINFMLTQALTGRVDQFQCSVENDTLLSAQDKVRYLRGMDNLLKFFNTSTLSKRVNPVLLPDILTAFEQCIRADKGGKSIYPIINDLSYAVAYSVVRADRVTFEKNGGLKSSQDAVILKYCLLRPNHTFQILKENPDVPFADSMVRVVAKKYPRQLYDYAQANNKLGAIIRNIHDDIFIRSVVRMARSKDGQQYFPFLDNIVKGKMTLEDIDSVKNDSIKYYRLLVNTQVDYVERAMNKDTAMESRALWAKLETRAREVFVNEINGLHELDDPIRFKIIQPLNAQELYYLAVSTDGLIYTSSFVKGVYPLMMKKIGNRSDSLLRVVLFDKYRKFIKMAAGYNTLSNFLGSFPNQDDASNLMRAFVKNLEKSDGLEDGVDVADSYASIAESIRPLAKEMLSNVQEN